MLPEEILTLLQVKVDLLLGFVGALTAMNVYFYKEMRGGKWNIAMKIGLVSSIVIVWFAAFSTISCFFY